MVDDPKLSESIPENAKAGFEKFSELAKKAAIDAAGFTGSLSDIKSKFDGLTSKFNEAMRGMNSVGAASEETAAKITLAANATINAKIAFQNLGGVDSGSLSTFGDQLAYIKEALTSNTVASNISKSALEGMAAGLLKLGVGQGAISKAMKEGAGAVLLLGSEQMKSADNALRLEAAYMHQMAATGDLGRAYEKSGSNLGHLNAVMGEQSNMLANVGIATNKMPKDVNAAYDSFMKIPGALDSVVEMSGVAGGKLNGLTAIMKLADGTHRNFAEVNKDVADATKLFTSTTEDSKLHMGDAMKFTARFTELSKNLNIPLVDVQKSLMTGASGLMAFTNTGAAAFRMTQGLSTMINEYSGGLMKAGLNGEEANKVVTDMTKSMGEMTTAQKSFLSAQTGGPGGLRGAAQIEKMMREGDIEGVNKKVQQSLKKQFGRIVTQDDATKSEADAAQYQKQKLLISQGPLGGMVKGDKNIAAYFDNMKSGKPGGLAEVKKLSDNVLSDSVNKGSVWQEKSYGLFGDMVQSLNKIEASVRERNLNILERAQGTASTGNTAKDTAGSIEGGKRRKAAANEAMHEGARDAEVANSRRLAKNKLNKHIAGAAKGGVNTIKGAVPGFMQLIEEEMNEGKEVIGLNNTSDKKFTPAQEMEAEKSAIKNKAAIGAVLKPGSHRKNWEARPFEPLDNAEAETAADKLAQAQRGTPGKADGSATPGEGQTITKNVVGPDNMNIEVSVKVNNKQSDNATAKTPVPSP